MPRVGGRIVCSEISDAYLLPFLVFFFLGPDASAWAGSWDDFILAGSF